MDSARFIVEEAPLTDERTMVARWHAWQQVWNWLLSDPPTEDDIAAGVALEAASAFLLSSAQLLFQNRKGMVPVNVSRNLLSGQH